MAQNQEADFEKEIRALKEVGQRTEGISASSSHSSSDIEKDDRVQVSSVAPESELPKDVATVKEKAQIGEFIAYFSEWRHAKVLIGTCTCWFLLDIAYAVHSYLNKANEADASHSFYGINLNQNVVLTQIGFGGKTGSDWEKLFKISLGNLIVTALGFVPGTCDLSPDFIPWLLIRCTVQDTMLPFSPSKSLGENGSRCRVSSSLPCSVSIRSS